MTSAVVERGYIMPDKLWPPARRRRRNCRGSEATTHAENMLLIELAFFAAISEKRIVHTGLVH